MGAQCVINSRYLEFSGRQPLQSRRNIARPNLPSGTVFEFNNVTLVMLLNSHAISPGAHIGAPNERLSGWHRFHHDEVATAQGHLATAEWLLRSPLHP